MPRLRQHHITGLLLVLVGALVFLAPMTSAHWEPWVKPLVYHADGSLRPDGVMRTVGIFLYQHVYDHHAMWPLGVLLLVGGLGVLLRGIIPWSRNPLTRTAQILGTLVTCASVLFTLPVFFVSPDIAMSLLNWGTLVFGLTVAGIAFAVAAGLPALFREVPRAPAFVGLLLCLSPLPVSIGLMSLAYALLRFRLTA